jgi:hypothetical protein
MPLDCKRESIAGFASLGINRDSLAQSTHIRACGCSEEHSSISWPQDFSRLYQSKLMNKLLKYVRAAGQHVM